MGDDTSQLVNVGAMHWSKRANPIEYLRRHSRVQILHFEEALQIIGHAQHVGAKINLELVILLRCVTDWYCERRVAVSLQVCGLVTLGADCTLVAEIAQIFEPFVRIRLVVLLVSRVAVTTGIIVAPSTTVRTAIMRAVRTRNVNE